MSNVELIGPSRKNWGQRETAEKRCHGALGSDLDLEVAIAKQQDPCRLYTKRQLPVLTIVLEGASSLSENQERSISYSHLSFTSWRPF